MESIASMGSMGSFSFISPVESIAGPMSSWLRGFPSPGCSDPGAVEHGGRSAGGDVQLGCDGHPEHVATHGNQTGGHRENWKNWENWNVAVEIIEISSNFLMAKFPIRFL